MSSEEFIDSIQTAAMIVGDLALIYAIYLLRQELKGATSLLRDVVKTQSQLHQNVRRVWERIDALETRQGIKGDVDTFIRMKRLLDAIEKPPPSPSPRPPDED
jgi:hypothetical protein